MPNSSIIYTYAYHPEEGIVNDFLSSDEFRDLYESNDEPPLLTPLPMEQIWITLTDLPARTSLRRMSAARWWPGSTGWTRRGIGLSG